LAFRGTFEFTLDAKNRLTIPAKLRAALADGVVLAKGLEPCVSIWRPGDYDAWVGQVLAGVNPGSRQARDLQRYFQSNSLETELDSAGRVMLPGFLLEHGALRRDVVVLGVGGSLEVWDRAGWQDHNATLSASAADLTESLGHPS
jgi:MraZ protein